MASGSGANPRRRGPGHGEPTLQLNTPLGVVELGPHQGIHITNTKVVVSENGREVRVIDAIPTRQQTNPQQQQPRPKKRTHPTATQQPRQEYVAINRPRAELTTKNYLTSEENELWDNFFWKGSMTTESVFVEYNGYVEARKMLWAHGFITITGNPGDGKTWMAEHLVTNFVKPEEKVPSYYGKKEEREKYEKRCIPDKGRGTYTWAFVKSADEWKRKLDTSRNQIVVIDDIFGPASLDLKKMKEWTPVLQDILEALQKHKPKLLVIITLHRHQMERLPRDIKDTVFFKSNVVDLPTREYCPEDYEREKIMSANAGFCGRSWSFYDRGSGRYNNVYQSFPFVCKMYAMVKSFAMEGQMFFQNPSRSFENVIQKVYSFDKTIYFTLCCCILFDGDLDLDKYTFEEFTDKQQFIIRQLREALEVPDDVEVDKVRYAAELLNGIFFCPTARHCWTFTHERSFHLVLENMARKISKQIIELCSRNFLMTRIRTTTYFSGTFESCITIWNQEFKYLAQRFTFEALSGGLEELVYHPALNDPKFVVAWFEFMTDMGSLLPAVNQRAGHNRSLMFWAAFHGYDEIVKQFLKHEDLAQLREEQWFKDELEPALVASCCGSDKNHAKVFDLLVEAGVPLEAKESLPMKEVEEIYGWEVAFLIDLKAPLLHFAALRGKDPLITSLIKKGADPNAKSADGYSPLHRAVFNNEIKVLDVLINMKADVNYGAPNGRQPIHMAMITGHGEYINRLRKAGVDLKNKTMPDGTSLLSSAATLKDEWFVKHVIDYNTETTGHLSKDLMSPLSVSVGMGDERVVKRLLEAKADVNSKGPGGWTALHYATYFYNEPLIDLLVENGAEVNTTAYNNKTPLHIAAQEGYIEMCNVLLNKGANPDLKTSSGEFPCTLAAISGHVDVTKFLIRQGIEDTPVDDMFEGQDMKMMMMMRHHPMFRH